MLTQKKYNKIRKEIERDIKYKELLEKLEQDPKLEIRESISGDLYLGYRR
jgi:hypothetical protein